MPFVQVATVASAQEDRDAADKELAMIKQQLNLMIRQEEDAAEVCETESRRTFGKMTDYCSRSRLLVVCPFTLNFKFPNQ